MNARAASVRALWVVALQSSLAISPTFVRETSAPARAASDINRSQTNTSSTCLAPLLQRIVDDAGVVDAQRLHVGPPVREAGGAYVRIYWPAQRAILIVDLADTAPPCAPADVDPAHERAAMSWYRAKARIDLDVDVVATPEDVGGSTYRVDRAWVDAVLAECLKPAPLTIRPSLRD